MPRERHRVRVATDAMQRGAVGISAEYPIGRYIRDATVCRPAKAPSSSAYRAAR